MKASSLPLFRRQLGAVIRQQRQCLGLSQAAFASRLDCTVNYVGKVERGEQNLRIDTLDRIFATILETSAATRHKPTIRQPVIPPSLALIHALAMSFGISVHQVTTSLSHTDNGGQQLTRGARKAQEEAQDHINPSERTILTACQQAAKSASEVRQTLGYTSRNGNFKRSLTHLIDLKLLRMKIPHRPRSKNQRYLTTDKGRAVLANTP